MSLYTVTPGKFQSQTGFFAASDTTMPSPALKRLDMFQSQTGFFAASDSPSFRIASGAVSVKPFRASQKSGQQ
jgi:hypothetical protein